MKNKVYIFEHNAPGIDKNEALRYAGAGKADTESVTLLDSCIAEAEDKLSYKCCYARLKIDVLGDVVDMGFERVNSHSLARCLAGCTEAVVFCATIGVGIDRLIARYSAASPARAMMLQALGSERVEALCDEFCAWISEEERAVGRETGSRFSPGYGDLALDLQRSIFAYLNPTKHIGVALNDNLFMSPSKSVTAIIGIKRI